VLGAVGNGVNVLMSAWTMSAWCWRRPFGHHAGLMDVVVPTCTSAKQFGQAIGQFSWCRPSSPTCNVT